ncbi:hypothetical protein Hdeb2414_s1042g00976091 [Helianthus debilis subsp. tardiflorus]
MAVTQKLHEERSFSDNYLWTKRSRKVTYRHEAKNLELNRRKNLRCFMFSTIFVKKVFCNLHTHNRDLFLGVYLYFFAVLSNYRVIF